jgi:hypothetical protein
MRSRLFTVFGVVILLLALEFAGRGCVDYTLSTSMHSNVRQARNVTVASGDVPLLYHYGILGELSNGTVTLHDIVADPISVSELRVSASTLKFDRGKFLSGEAKITGTPPYQVQVVLSAKNLSDELTSRVVFQSKVARVVVDGHTISAMPTLDGRFIVIKDAKKTVRISLPGKDILPCDPTGIGIGNGVAVACESNTLPKVLADAAK